MIRCPNPTCGRLYASEVGKCPWCLTGFYGHVSEKHVVQPRDLVAKYACAHGIIRTQQCSKCQNSPEDREDYRQHMLAEIKNLLIATGVPKSQAWERAKIFHTAVEAIKAQKHK